MSDSVRICLVGATGLIGATVIRQAAGRRDISLFAIARREMQLPEGSRMVLVVADTSGWAEAIAAAQASVLVCALGTTWRKAGKDQAAFRAVDLDLVLACAQAAKAAGIEHLIVVSSVGAEPAARSFYLRVKGDAEAALGKMGFRRLDILRPGLLRGQRRNDPRMVERLAMVLSPAVDTLLRGKFRQYRSVRSATVANAIFALAKERAAGRFIHDHDAMLRALRRRGG